MTNLEARAKLETMVVSGILATAINLKDKALLLEKEIGTETVFTMIAMGEPLVKISGSLGLTAFELEYILKRTPALRKEYLNAKAVAMGEASMTTVSKYSDTTYMETEQAAAFNHHNKTIDRALKVANADADKGEGGVVVNNTVIVRNENEVPPLPDELQNVIEGEYADT